ncbi:MAG: hypothetical protein HZB13_10210 [Acidobacteria bacterium]|nr:hypothetical protein [Acidobacteriota bacterium]
MNRAFLLAVLLNPAFAQQHTGDPAIAAGAVALAEALQSIGQPPAPLPLEIHVEPGAAPPEGFTWTPAGSRGRLSASTPLGAAFGLERLAWLTRAHRSFPPPATSETPALPHRYMFTAALVADSAEGPPGDPAELDRAMRAFTARLHTALRFGYSGVMFRGLEHYVPSNDPVYGPRSERYRRYLQAALTIAHRHHMKIFLYAEEAIYLPAWLESSGAAPSVKDPRFWAVLSDKYRRLFRAVPDLDGVTPCLGEIIPSYGFRALDLIHSREPEPDPRIEERYRAFLTAVHTVVSGEFGKPVLPWTWATNDWELSAVPSIYRATFNAQMPLRDLLPVIKLTKLDAWYYGSAFNPTFGQSRHSTIALGEPGSQYQGLGTFVDFPARWAAAALQFAAERGAQGAIAGEPLQNLLQPGVLYVFSRMSWNPASDSAAHVREWTAAVFGPAVADAMTHLLFAGSDAARAAYYFPAVSLDGWSPQPHIRVDRFILRGNFMWDSGRAHDSFLRTIYLKLKPYSEETWQQAARAAEIVAAMRREFDSLRPRINPPEAAARFDQLLTHSSAVSALTRDYTRLILDYFHYRETGEAADRRRLETATGNMRASAAAYRAAHKFYKLDGIDMTLELASRLLANRENAEKVLRDAPTDEQLAARFAAAREADRALLAGPTPVEKILTWRGSIDGRDMLHIQGTSIRIQNLSGDGVHSQTAKFEKPVPAAAATRWVIRPLDVRGVAYVAQAPSAANGYTLSIYLDDPEASSAVFEFEVYRVREQ